MGKNLGLAVTAEGWALAVISWGKTGRLTQLLSGEWSPEEPVSTKAAILKQVFERYRLAKEKVVVSVPMKAGYWKELRLPALPPREMVMLIKNTFFSGLQEVPTEFCWQYKKYQAEGKEQRVVCFALPDQVGNEIKALMDQAALNPLYFSPDLYSLSKGLNVIAPRGYHPAEITLLVIIRAHDVEVALVKDGDLVYYRSFPLLLTDGVIERGAVEEDLRLTKFMMRKENRYLANTCYFWDQTGQCDEEEWQTLIASAFGLELNRVQPFSALGLPADFRVGKREAILRRLMAVGLAMEEKTKEPGLRLVIGNNRPSRGGRQKALCLLVFGLLMVLIGAGFNAWLNYREKQTLIGQLVRYEEKVEAIKDLIALEEQCSEQVGFYWQDWKKTRQMLEFLNVWSETVPEGTILTAVVLDREQITQLSGRCLSFSQLYATLLNSPDFRQLQLKGEITVNRDGYEGFTLVGRWNEENEDEY